MSDKIGFLWLLHASVGPVPKFMMREVEMEKVEARSNQPWLHLIVTKGLFKKY